MRYYSVDVERELSTDRLEVPADLVGHHLRLQFACALLEHAGGLIRGCKRWSENRWRRLAGVTKRTLRRLEKWGLVQWCDENLLTHEFNDYGLAVQQERRCHASKIAKSRWSKHAARIAAGSTKDQGSKRDPGATSSGSGPPIAQRPPSSSSPIEVVEAGGGGLPDGDWERIWSELPNRRQYWEDRARPAIEAVVVPDEVMLFLDWLDTQKKTPSWKRSPPTPLTVAGEYRDRRRAAKAGSPKRRSTDRTAEPSKDQIRASWAAVVKEVERASTQRKGTPT